MFAQTPPNTFHSMSIRDQWLEIAFERPSFASTKKGGTGMVISWPLFCRGSVGDGAKSLLYSLLKKTPRLLDDGSALLCGGVNRAGGGAGPDIRGMARGVEMGGLPPA